MKFKAEGDGIRQLPLSSRTISPSKLSGEPHSNADNIILNQNLNNTQRIIFENLKRDDELSRLRVNKKVMSFYSTC